MSFQTGSLVRARGRDWTVLPGSTDAILLARPLGGAPSEDAALLLQLEDVSTSEIQLPTPDMAADSYNCRLIREALRFGNRNTCGPFRCFGRLGFSPHAYQLVPLLLALRQETVRLLIADDVGIGKTIEACLIARELLDRGDIERFWVLTPPHLAYQWQQELQDKFHLHADVVLPGTISRLEREGSPGASVFNRDHLIVSLDFAKREIHRDAVIAHAPDLIIVDEAHTCSLGDVGGRGRHQRHRLVTLLAEKKTRNVVLVTATPHSGKGGAFRSLLGLLDSELEQLPDELQESHRLRLARHFIQRRRVDVRNDAKFPNRQESDITYKLTAEYQKLFDDVIELARETVEFEGSAREVRIRWWSALSLLRALASSPRAAAATLETRSGLTDLATAQDVDEIGEEHFAEGDEDADGEMPDILLGGDYTEALPADPSMRKRFAALAKRARALEGKADPKLAGIVTELDKLIEAKLTPVVFCRFINTAEYVAEHLRKHFGDRVEIRPVTGKLPPEAREQQVSELAEARHAGKPAILVATDCLSEGINLQQHFNAVVHYDLAWNPTRHEQREGRVDRFGQEADEVAIRTYYGIDNRIDGLVLQVLLNKHRTIRRDLKLAIPVPANMVEVQQAIMEGLFLRKGSESSRQGMLEGFSHPSIDRIQREWTRISEEEQRSRSIFSQQAIPVTELQEVLQASLGAAGDTDDVGLFVRDGLKHFGANVTGKDPAKIRPAGLEENLRDRLGLAPDADALRLGFTPPVPEGVDHIPRTHNIVQGLAEYILDRALDPEMSAGFGRCGAIFTAAVDRSTVVLLTRFRFNLHIRRDRATRVLLAEDYGLHAFDLTSADPLGRERGLELLDALPAKAMPDGFRKQWCAEGIAQAKQLVGVLEAEAALRARELREQHEKVRAAATKGRAGQVGSIATLQAIEALLPVDIIGVYVYLPAGAPA